MRSRTDRSDPVSDLRTVSGRLAILMTVGAMLAYKAVLDVSYVTVIGPGDYYALQPAIIDPMKLGESYVALLLVALSISYRRQSISVLFLGVTILLSYVPMLTIYAMRDGDRTLIWATTAFWIVVVVAVQRLPNIRLTWVQRRASVNVPLIIYAAMLLVAVIVMLQHGAALLDNLLSTQLDLSNFYANRQEFVAADLPLNGYYFHWLALVFNPLFMTWAVMRHRYFSAVLIAVTQIPIAVFVGQRGYVFSLAFALATAWAASRRVPLAVVAAGIGGTVVAAVLVAVATGHKVVYFFFTGRFLLDAAQLTYYYYDFFTHHPAVPFGYMIHYYLHLPYPWPYTQSPDYVIGAAYFGQHLAAVGGLIADAVMNFGLAGLVIWAAGLILLCKVIDAAAWQLSPALAMSALAMPALSLANTYSVRVLFTTGLAWAILLLLLSSRQVYRQSGEAAETAEVIARATTLAQVPRHAKQTP